MYDTAFVIEKYTDIAKWFEFKNTKAFWPGIWKVEEVLKSHIF